MQLRERLVAGRWKVKPVFVREMIPAWTQKSHTERREAGTEAMDVTDRMDREPPARL
jgi:hypothetical protein